MSEVKQRKKGLPSSKSNEGFQKLEKHSSRGKVVSHGQNSVGMDSRMALGVISLSACLVLAWLLFQQSSRFADMEKRYNFLQQEAERFLDMENKVSLISEKLESSDSILQESASSISVMTEFEQEVSSLRNTIREIENNEQTLFMEMQGINEKFQNITNSWRRSMDEMNTNTSGIKSEAKFIHTEVTTQINKVDQRIKSLSERLKDLEDGTARNIKTVKRQEDDEFAIVEQKLDSHATAIEKLEEEQNSLLAKNTDLSQKLAAYEPKIEECKTHLPKIENAIHSILRLSSELLNMEKKIENLATQLYTVESNMLKTVSAGRLLHMLTTAEGVMTQTDRLNGDGLQEVFTTNLFGHFILIRQLESLLCGNEKPSRLIWTSSSNARESAFSLSDYQHAKGQESYSSSKYATDLTSVVLNRKFNKQGLYSSVVCPGLVMSNMTFKILPVFLWVLLMPIMFLIRFFAKTYTLTPYNGAEAHVWLFKQKPEYLDPLVKYHSCTSGLGKNFVEPRKLDVDEETAEKFYQKLLELEEQTLEKYGDLLD